ncbi:site-specific integrase [Coprobacter tertius]|uniref:Site-specific integrase n=1 Tax=Coprobacter tertius TaxID=2944915 RepID=A0ABT1MGF3_9BACT|nr:site-specific integrase [Coprobacter tertius]
MTAKNTEANFTNEILDRWEEAALRVISHFKKFYNTPLKEEFFKKLDEEFYIDDPNDRNIYFIDYINKYIERYRGVKSKDLINKFQRTRDKLIEYEKYLKKRLVFSDINIDFYNLFKEWFFEKGYSTNYFGNNIRNIKQIYTEAKVVDHIHNLSDINHRDFIGIKVDTDSIYLTEDELKKIYDFDFKISSIKNHFKDISDENAKKKIKSYKLVRDRFLIGAYTGLRVSDYGRLNELNIDDNFIRIRAKKTGKESIIPIHPYIRNILNNGFDPNIRVSDQKINEHIKEIARIAGITDKVLINKHIQGKYVQFEFEKCDLISTHTARRSFATNAYKAGVPVIAIMKITGHSKQSTFLKYIKVDEKENAEILSNHPFFK